MVLGLRASEWLPVVLTPALFALVVFGADAIATRAWADLLGLFCLAVAPFLYSRLKAVVPRDLDRSSLPADLRPLVRQRAD